MKTKRSLIYFIVLIISIQLIAFNSSAQQWDIGGNVNNSHPNFNKLGSSNAKRIRIVTSDIERMLFDSNAADIGVGDFSTPGLTAQSRLHLYESTSGSLYQQFTNLTTGAGSDSVGFRVGINANEEAELRQESNKDMLFYTDRIERMRILGPGIGGTNAGSVGIGTATPGSPTNATSTLAGTVLHVKAPGVGDQRGRMIIESGDGTGSNNAGLLFWDTDDSTDQHGFVLFVNKGVFEMVTTLDNMSTPSDYFTAKLSTGEIGINKQPTLGIRFDILEGTNPQLRLTNAANVYTNFHTTATGNLLINPSNSGTPANVGIGLSVASQPAERLHVDEFIRSNSLGAANTLGPLGTTDGMAISNIDGTLFTRLTFPGQNNQFLRADGVWQTISGAADNDWVISNPSALSFSDVFTALPGHNVPDSTWVSAPQRLPKSL